MNTSINGKTGSERKIIELQVSKVCLKLCRRETLVSGARNVYLCKFAFDRHWEGVDRTAMFQAGTVRISVPLDGEDQCQIPWEVLAVPGKTLMVGVYGTKNGELILPTQLAKLGEIQKGAALGDNTREPTPNVYDQILAEATQAREIAQNLREEAESGAFDGSVAVSVAEIPGGHRVTITGANGPQSFDVMDGTAAGLPAYWQAYVDSGVEEIRRAMEAAGRNRSAFLFYTDAHWESNSQNSPALLNYLHQHSPINKTFFGGDIVSEESDDPQEMDYLWAWRAAIRDLPNHYSVVGNHDDGNSVNNRFSEKYVYAFLQAPEETPTIVRGDAGLWYYLDCPSERTRYLCMDTAFQANLDSQADFVIQALDTTPDGWHIVAVSHIWLANAYGSTVTIAGIDETAAKWLAVFDDYNARAAGSVTIHTAEEPYDFTGAGGRVEFCIGGHTHVDNAAYSSQGGIPIITLESDAHNSRSGLASQPGTASEQAVSGVIADYDEHKLHIIRIGRGASFHVDLPGAVPAQTNWIPLSVDVAGNCYNGIGKKDKTWISAGDGTTENASENSWVTGLIPVEKGDVIQISHYFKQAGLTSNTNGWRFMFYNGDKSFNRSKYMNEMVDFLDNPMVWEGEDIVRFTFSGTSSAFKNTKFFRLGQCDYPTEAERLASFHGAVVTINEGLEA